MNNISIAWEPFGIFTVPGVSQTPRCCQLFIVKNFRFWLQTAWKYRAHYPVHKSVYVEKRSSSSSKTCLRSLTSLKLFLYSYTVRVVTGTNRTDNLPNMCRIKHQVIRCKWLKARSSTSGTLTPLTQTHSWWANTSGIMCRVHIEEARVTASYSSVGSSWSALEMSVESVFCRLGRGWLRHFTA